MTDAKQESNDSPEMSKGLIMKVIELLLKLFGVNLGKGGGMPLDQAIKQPQAEQKAVEILEDKTTQWLCKQALKIPGVEDMAKDYLNDNPEVKAFAQKVLDNPKLQDFKNDLQQSGMLDKMELNAKNTNSPQAEKQADLSPLEMGSPKSSQAISKGLGDSDDYPMSEPSFEKNSAPQEESSNQMRPS